MIRSCFVFNKYTQPNRYIFYNKFNIKIYQKYTEQITLFRLPSRLKKEIYDSTLISKPQIKKWLFIIYNLSIQNINICVYTFLNFPIAFTFFITVISKIKRHEIFERLKGVHVWKIYCKHEGFLFYSKFLRFLLWK